MGSTRKAFPERNPLVLYSNFKTVAKKRGVEWLVMAVQMCYNRGCGKEYNIRQNFEDSCRYHPGDPYFHDAYKGWSCCQNKSTDFTTFLNTPGCALGKHSNVKPINPEKITGNLNKEPEPVVVETRPPIQPEAPRPSYDTPMTRLEPRPCWTWPKRSLLWMPSTWTTSISPLRSSLCQRRQRQKLTDFSHICQQF